MRDEILHLWTRALRSGKYKQTSGHLRNGDSYDVLGVLCSLYADYHGIILHLDGPFWKQNDLPVRVSAWAGINSSCGFYDGMRRSLVKDSNAGKTFSQLADIIEIHFSKVRSCKCRVPNIYEMVIQEDICVKCGLIIKN